MQKALLKLLLAFFIFTVIAPGGFALNETDGNSISDYYQVSIKKQVQARPLVKNIHQLTTLAHSLYKSDKSFFDGDLLLSNLQHTIGCNSFELQTQQRVIYRKNYLRSLLFPHHFFS